LAIVDMEMPVMNGLELIRAIRANDEEFPIIAITGYSHIYLAKEVLALNVEAFLKKPLNLKELAELVERIVNR
jgi:YesN/AraC family two-component response regulator